MREDIEAVRNHGFQKCAVPEKAGGKRIKAYVQELVSESPHFHGKKWLFQNMGKPVGL